MAIGSNPRYLEELRIGGGYGESDDGGADFEKNGDISTDGHVTLKGVLNAGSTPQALTNAAGEIDGTKVQAGTIDTAQLANDAVDATKLDETGDYTVNDLVASGSITASGGSLAVGVSDAVRGNISLNGGSGSVGGGTLTLWNSGDDDSYTERYVLYGEPATGNLLLRAIAGVSGTTEDVLLVDDDTHDCTFTKDVAVKGGDLEVGTDGGARGVVTAWDGSGGNAPGCIKLASPNGTPWYLFVEDDGTLKVHNALPTQNSDGTVVGTQT